MQKYWCNCGSQSCVWEGWGHGMKLHNNNIKWKFALEIITSINCLLSCDIYISHCCILVCFGELNWLVLFLHSSLFSPLFTILFFFSSSVLLLMFLLICHSLEIHLLCQMYKPSIPIWSYWVWWPIWNC